MFGWILITFVGFIFGYVKSNLNGDFFYSDVVINLTETNTHSINIPLNTSYESDRSSSVYLYSSTTPKVDWVTSKYSVEKKFWGFTSFDIRKLTLDDTGNFLYCSGDHSYMIIFDVTDETNPIFVSNDVIEDDVTSEANTIIYFENYVYIQTMYKLYVVSVSDPYSAFLDKTVDLNSPQTCFRDGDYIIAFGSSRIYYYDISTRNNPFLVKDHFMDEYLDGMYDSYIKNGYAFLAADDSGMAIFSISNMDEVERVSLVNPYDGRVRGIFVDENDIAYLYDEYNGLILMNISDVYNPLFMSRIHYIRSYNYISSSSYIYLADYNYGFMIINATDVFNPVEVGSWKFDPISIRDVYYRDDLIYLASGKGGIRIIDSSISKTTPSYISESPVVEKRFSGNRLKLSSLSSYLYVADSFNGIKIYDVRDISSPKLVGFYQHEWWDVVEDLDVDEVSNLLYYTTRRMNIQGSFKSYIRIINITNISNPEHVYSKSTTDSYGIFVKDNLLYSTDYTSCIFKIMNVTNPSSPEEISTTSTSGGNPTDIIITKNMEVYIISQTCVEFWDILDPGNPVLKNELCLEGSNSISGIYIDDDLQLMYLGQESSGLKIADVSNFPDDISVVAEYYDGYSICRPVLDSNVIFSIGCSAYYFGGYEVYDEHSSNIRNNFMEFSIGNMFSDIVILSGERVVFIAEEIHGLVIYKIADSVEFQIDVPVDEVSCGNVMVNIVVSDGESVIEDEFVISVLEMCVESQGTCNFTDFSCVCSSSSYGNFYTGQYCEEYECFGVEPSHLLRCSGNGNCTNLDFCSCSQGYIGEECEIKDFKCYNISAYTGDRGVLCGGHGTCQSQDFCVCDSGYFTTFDDDGRICSVYFCGKYEMDDPEVCNQRGSCEESQKCNCIDDYEGDDCETWSCYGSNKDDFDQVCSGNGDCESPNECICIGTYIEGNMCEKNTVYEEVMAPILSLFFTFVFLVFTLLCCGCCVCCICCICCFFITSFSTTGYLFYIVVKQRFGIKKFSRLKNVDLLLREQDLDEDTSVAHLRIDRSLFEIPFEEIQLSKIIGEGGSESTVFQAKWQDRDVALKSFKTRTLCGSQQSFDEFEREVRVMASLSHPNVIRFFGATLKPPRVGIVMEFCQNGEIIHFFKKYRKKNENKCYPIDEKIRLIGEICSSMRYLHSRNIIHRDLKCENVLVDSQEHTKLMDFGLSRIVERMSVKKTYGIGTSQYMAPEIVKGGSYSEKCDVFSFGITIWVIFTENMIVYGGNYEGNIEYQVANDPELRPSMTELRQCLRKDYPQHFFRGMENTAANNNSEMMKGGLGKCFKKQMKWMVELMNCCWHHLPAKRKSFEEIFIEYFPTGGMDDWKEMKMMGERKKKKKNEENVIEKDEIQKEMDVFEDDLTEDKIDGVLSQLEEKVSLLSLENEERRKEKEELELRIRNLL